MSLSLGISFDGVDAVLAAADRVIQRGGEAQRHEIQVFGASYKQALIDATPRGRGPKRGKRLFERYRVSERYAAASASYRITNDTKYLPYVLNGRPAVYAKPGGVLRFEIAGTVYYRKSVGPAAANPYDEKVAAQMQRDSSGLADRIAGQVVRMYEGK